MNTSGVTASARVVGEKGRTSVGKAYVPVRFGSDSRMSVGGLPFVREQSPESLPEPFFLEFTSRAAIPAQLLSVGSSFSLEEAEGQELARLNEQEWLLLVQQSR